MVILMNIDLVITLKTILTLWVLVVCRLSQHLTSCSAITKKNFIVFNELCEVDVNLPNASDKKYGS